MDVSVSIQDIIKYYIGSCCFDKLQTTLSGHPPSTEQLWATVREVREILILITTLLGAFPRKRLEQISRLNRKSLALENKLHRVEKLGEDFVMLRQWTKSAQDSQWDIAAASALLKSDFQALPLLTGDLIVSHKKPFVVVSSLKSRASEVQKRLHVLFACKFENLKNTRKIPERTEYEFFEDASIEIRSSNEFDSSGIFDGKRWFVVKAKLHACLEASDAFREVLQRADPEKIIQTAFRICTKAKMRRWATMASTLEDEFIYSVERQPLKISFCQAASFPCYLTASVAEDGDMCLTAEPACSDLSGLDSFQVTIEKFVKSVRKRVMKAASTEMSRSGMNVFSVGVGELLVINRCTTFLVSLGTRGNPTVKCPSRLGDEAKKTTIASLPQLILDLSVSL